MTWTPELAEELGHVLGTLGAAWVGGAVAGMVSSVWKRMRRVA